MSYSGYGGNPYRDAEAGYGNNNTSNPYQGTAASGYGGSNPYGGNSQSLDPPPPLHHDDSNYSQGSQYSAPSAPHTNVAGQPTNNGGYTANAGSAPLSRDDFRGRIEGAKARIDQLTLKITEIAKIHQRLLSSVDDRSSAQLENIVSQTQILNTGIKDEIKFLERDAARDPDNSFKKSQVGVLTRSFKAQLRKFQEEESSYSQRYRDAIARQYRIINPDATEQEVNEAANADWGDEGIFQQALKSNRSGQASSVLGAVRARHNDIQRIEKTMIELNQLFVALAEEVAVQEQPVARIEDDSNRVHEDTVNVNEQLTKGVVSARRARKLKWWCFWIVVAIICILALALGLFFGLPSSSWNRNKN